MYTYLQPKLVGLVWERLPQLVWMQLWSSIIIKFSQCIHSFIFYLFIKTIS